jgi:hypothetical protein
MTARRSKPHHLYSVFVNTSDSTTLVYLGSSEATARTTFARAVMHNPNAVSVEIRRDLKPWLRVLIERPS